MAGRLEGKVALVTGGASGIGRAAAVIFAREGAKVAVSDVVPKQGEEVAQKIKEAGGVAAFFPCDVSRATDVEALVANTVKAFGRLDCAFNNAGVVGPVVKTADESEENFDRIIAIDLKGVWLCLKYEIKQMLKQGGGAIVNTSSAAGLVGSHGMAAYTAAKHAVAGLTKTAALEYSSKGIRINAVCPGIIQTPMLEGLEADKPQLKKLLLAIVPMGRKGQPEEIGETVAFLLSDAASFVSGACVSVDGAQVVQ